VIGNIGVLLIVGSYLLAQLRRMSAVNPPYIVLNGLGATLILYSLWFDFNLSAFLIELIWLLISLVGLGRWFLESRHQQTQRFTGSQRRSRPP